MRASIVAGIVLLCFAGCATTDPSAIEAVAAPVPVSETVLVMEPAPPMPGTSVATVESWTTTLDRYHFQMSTPEVRMELRAEIESWDPVEAAPAYINVLIGRDMADPDDVSGAFQVVQDWQAAVVRKPHFFFADSTRMTERDINNRLAVIDNWRGYWLSKIASPEKIADWRRLIAGAREQQEGVPSGR